MLSVNPPALSLASLSDFYVVRQLTDTRSSAAHRILSVSRTIGMTPDIHYIKVQKAQLIAFQFREDV